MQLLEYYKRYTQYRQITHRIKPTRIRVLLLANELHQLGAVSRSNCDDSRRQ